VVEVEPLVPTTPEPSGLLVDPVTPFPLPVVEVLLPARPDAEPLELVAEIPFPVLVLTVCVLVKVLAYAGFKLSVTAPPLVTAFTPLVPVTLVIPPPPPPLHPEPHVTAPVTLSVPFTVKVAGLEALPKFTVGAVPSTSSVACGVAVPMPTFTAAALPAGPPRTIALFWPTTEPEPIAAA
jgi:hypothetical protein